jgi:hypothetical protein
LTVLKEAATAFGTLDGRLIYFERGRTPGGGLLEVARSVGLKGSRRGRHDSVPSSARAMRRLDGTPDAQCDELASLLKDKLAAL